ncbi:ABC transporter substrate-binding protein [bacterium]|nr:ABC transporter substrate-binding protein [bacterium]
MNIAWNILRLIEKADWDNTPTMTNYQLSIINIQPKKCRLKILQAYSFRAIVFYLYFIACILVLSSPLFAQDSSPKKIISLGPAITRQLSLLDVEDKIIGVTIYCDIDGKETIGTIMEANLERILLLKPDVVLATSLTNIKTIQRLKNLNINVAVFGEVKNFNQLCEQFLKLAQLVGKEKIGRAIISKAEEKLSNLSQKNKNLSKQKVVVQIGANPLWIATKDSMINDFVLLAGGINVGPIGENGLVSREYIVKQNPDVIIIIDMGILAEEEKGTWSKFDTINAVIQNRIHIFAAYDICSPTPLSFVGTLEELFELFCPGIGY